MILALLPLMFLQSSEHDLDSLYTLLLQKTAERREAASALWAEEGPKWLNGEIEQIPKSLRSFGSEIQDPALKELGLTRSGAGSTDTSVTPYPKTMNSALGI